MHRYRHTLVAWCCCFLSANEDLRSREACGGTMDGLAVSHPARQCYRNQGAYHNHTHMHTHTYPTHTHTPHTHTHTHTHTHRRTTLPYLSQAHGVNRVEASPPVRLELRGRLQDGVWDTDPENHTVTHTHTQFIHTASKFMCLTIITKVPDEKIYEPWYRFKLP